MYDMSFWSQFHRIFHFSFDHIGFLFDYKGDEITWIWPWRRINGKKWLSTIFEYETDTLKEIDKLWEDYLNAMMKYAMMK